MIRSLIVLGLLLAPLALALASVQKTTIFDFAEERSVRQWVSINDGVMGGVSSGRLEPTEQGTAVFTGNLSLANNGGFASVRSKAKRRDLAEFEGLALRVRGDGSRYKINLKNDAYLDGVLYRAEFGTVKDEWKTVYLPFDDFAPTFRGRFVRDAEPLDLRRVISFGLMISDKQEGPFRLELADISVFED